MMPIDKEADMNEDLATRAWADNHAKLSDGVVQAAHAIMQSLRVLHEKQYNAPWLRPDARRGSAKC
jgi:hypothetical protein